MHRSIEATVSAPLTDRIVTELQALKHVISLRVLRGASLTPAGDTIVIHVLNKGADDVLSLISRHTGNSHFTVITSEVASVNDPQHQRKIDRDVDEAIWEEMETGLRHNGRLTVNYLTLMAIGGIIASVGLVSDTHLSVTALVAASVIAPGLEPVAKIPLGVVLKNKDVVKTGLRSSIAGYLMLTITACTGYLLMSWFDGTSYSHFRENDVVKYLLNDELKGYLLSLVAAAASVIMYLSYRRNVIAGPLVVLIIIPGAAAFGISVVEMEWVMAGKFALRFFIDIMLIMLVGILLIFLKQKFLHKRAPLT